MAIQAVQVTPVTVSVETSCSLRSSDTPSLYYMYMYMHLYMTELEKDKAQQPKLNPKAVLLPWVGFEPRLPRQLR